MKRTLKIYIEEEVLKKLRTKAGEGRGAISRYIERIATQPICFLDENVKGLLSALQLNSRL